jgi:hypothetical protein
VDSGGRSPPRALTGSTLVPVDETGVSTDGGDAGDGMVAVLYGMFTSFTEALDGFDRRLAAIEAALQAGPVATAERLGAIEAALSRSGEGRSDAGTDAAGLDASVAAVGEALEVRTAAIEARMAALGETLDARVTALQGALEAHAAGLRRAVDELRVTLEAHVEETSHSFGRRAGEAGRRIVTDLSQRARPRPGSGPPPAGS